MAKSRKAAPKTPAAKTTTTDPATEAANRQARASAEPVTDPITKEPLVSNQRAATEEESARAANDPETEARYDPITTAQHEALENPDVSAQRGAALQEAQQEEEAARDEEKPEEAGKIKGFDEYMKGSTKRK